MNHSQLGDLMSIQAHHQSRARTFPYRFHGGMFPDGITLRRSLSNP
ncbi:hypothetical protein [Ktedonobacter robiniae]|nr:hypothetical protein [Ktedonobacter robiniae]